MLGRGGRGALDIMFTESAPPGQFSHRVAMSMCLSVCLSVCLLARLSVCLLVCLSLSLSFYDFLFCFMSNF